MTDPGQSLAGKVAIITGGASGIGRATARLFAREGASIIVVDVSEPAGKKVEQEITSNGGTAMFEAADVTCATDCRRVAQRAKKTSGRIDILFNNAGIILRPSILDNCTEEWDPGLRIHVN